MYIALECNYSIKEQLLIDEHLFLKNIKRQYD